MESKDHLNLLEPFVAKNETAVDAQSNDEETFLLTDRRLFTAKTKGRDNTRNIVTSLHLDLICRTEVEHKTTPDYDSDAIVYGAGSLVLALFAFALSGQFGDTAGPVLILVGAVAGIMGIALLLDGYNPGSGSVTISLQDDNGSQLKEIDLEEEQLEFAETISTTISSHIEPPGEVVRKVGN